MSLSNHSNNCPTLYSLLDYAHFVPRLTSTNSINGGTNRKTFHVSFGLVSSFIHYDLCWRPRLSQRLKPFRNLWLKMSLCLFSSMTIPWSNRPSLSVDVSYTALACSHLLYRFLPFAQSRHFNLPSSNTFVTNILINPESHKPETCFESPQISFRKRHDLSANKQAREDSPDSHLLYLRSFWDA